MHRTDEQNERCIDQREPLIRLKSLKKGCLKVGQKQLPTWGLPSGEMAAAMDEAEELGLPKATVVKVAAEFLPAGVKVNFSFGAAPACTCLLTSLLTLLAPCCAHATARSWCVHGHATEHANAMSGVCVCVCCDDISTARSCCFCNQLSSPSTHVADVARRPRPYRPVLQR